jgi:hypothetical protein
LKQKTERTENSYFPLFAANGKQKQQAFIYFSVNENGKQKFAFLDRKK